MTTNSEIVIHNGGTTFAGPDAVNLLRAAHLKTALNLYAKSGIRWTRNCSPTQMLAMATKYTGKSYKRGEYLKAAEDMRVWIETMKAALPVTDERRMFQVEDNPPITLAEFVRVNADDEDACAWASQAKVGELMPAMHDNVRRISCS